MRRSCVVHWSQDSFRRETTAVSQNLTPLGFMQVPVEHPEIGINGLSTDRMVERWGDVLDRLAST